MDCDANGTSYSDGSVVVFSSGNDDYRKCVDGSWRTSSQLGVKLEIKDLTTVPVYLQSQYAQATTQHQNANPPPPPPPSTSTTTNFTQAKATCEANGGFWRPDNTCGQGQGNCESFGGTWNGTTCAITKCVAKVENLGCNGGCRNERVTNADCTVSIRCVASSACTPAPVQPTTSITFNQQGSISIKAGVGGSCRFNSDCQGGLSCTFGKCGNALTTNLPTTVSQPTQSSPITGQPVPQTIPQYGICGNLTGSERDDCNKNWNTFYNVSNVVTYGSFTNYVNAYSPDKVKIAWQQAGYSSLQDCQQTLGKKYGARAATSCNTYELTKDQAVSSIQVGTALTADVAAVAAIPTAVTAGSVAAGASGATALSVTGAVGANLLTSVGVISTVSQTSNAAVAQIEDPLSQDANLQTFYAALSWTNLGTADFLANTFSNAASTAQAINNARALNTVVSAVNLGVDSVNAYSTCSQQGVLTTDCGGALVAAAADIGFGALDYRQGQLSLGNPFKDVPETSLVRPLADIVNPNDSRFATPDELKLIDPSVNESELVSQLSGPHSDRVETTATLPQTPSKVADTQPVDLPVVPGRTQDKPNLLTTASNLFDQYIVTPLKDILPEKPGAVSTTENLSSVREVTPEVSLPPEVVRKGSDIIQPKIKDALVTTLQETGTINNATVEFKGRMWDAVYEKGSPGFNELRAKGGDAAVDELINSLDAGLRKANSDLIFSPKERSDTRLHVTYPDIGSDRTSSLAKVARYLENDAPEVIKSISAKYGVNINTNEIKVSDYMWMGLGDESKVTFTNVGGTLVQSVENPVQGALLGLAGKEVPGHLTGGDYLPILEHRGAETADVSLPLTKKNINLEGTVVRKEEIGDIRPEIQSTVQATDSEINHIASTVGQDTSLTPNKIMSLLTPEQIDLLGKETINLPLNDSIISPIQLELGQQVVGSFDITPFSEVTDKMQQLTRMVGSPEEKGFNQIVSHFLNDISTAGKNNGGSTYKFAGDGAEMIFLDGLTPQALKDMVNISNSMNIHLGNALKGEYGADAAQAARFLEENFKDQIFVKVGAVKTDATLIIHESSGGYIPTEITTKVSTDDYLMNSKNYKNENGINQIVVSISPDLLDNFTPAQLTELKNLGMEVINDPTHGTFVALSNSPVSPFISITNFVGREIENVSAFGSMMAGLISNIQNIFSPTPVSP